MKRRTGHAGGDRYCPAIRHRLPRRQLLFHRSSDRACRRPSCSPGRPGTHSRLCQQSQEMPRRRDSAPSALSCPGVLSLSSRCRPPPCWPTETTSAFDSWMHGPLPLTPRVRIVADERRSVAKPPQPLNGGRELTDTAQRALPRRPYEVPRRGAARPSSPSQSPTRKGPAEDLTLQNLRPSPQRLSGFRPPWPAPCPRA